MSRRGRPAYPDVLTPRQWEVLARLREGLSNEQIALRLGISVDGVKFHVAEILSKLGVGSRNEAAQWDGEQRQPAPTACHSGVRHGHNRRLHSRTFYPSSGERRIGCGHRTRPLTAAITNH